MKKRILLFTAIAGMATIILTSGQDGAGSESGYDCTGTETSNGNGAGCSRGGSCHSTTATTGITVTVELDSAGSAITHYKPGTTYTVKITGTNTTSATLPKFGFQVACIKGSAAVATPTNAGTFATVSVPLRNTAANSNFFCNMVEHSTPIAATTLGGATGGTYVESFQWTAPAIGTGTVSIWGALNAVNGNGSADANDKWNTTHISLTEADTVAVSHVGVANIENNISVNAYPNPVSNNLNLQIDNAGQGQYSLQVYDLNGRNIVNENIEVTSAAQIINVNTNSWAPGIYHAILAKDGNYHITSVVKR